MHYIPYRSISTGPRSICNHWWGNSLDIPAKNTTGKNKNMVEKVTTVHSAVIYTFQTCKNRTNLSAQKQYH